MLGWTLRFVIGMLQKRLVKSLVMRFWGKKSKKPRADFRHSWKSWPFCWFCWFLLLSECPGMNSNVVLDAYRERCLLVAMLAGCCWRSPRPLHCPSLSLQFSRSEASERVWNRLETLSRCHRSLPRILTTLVGNRRCFASKMPKWLCHSTKSISDSRSSTS